MFCTIINDCRDDNAFGRQATRAASLLHCSVVTVGVKSELEAAGSLVDVLDASEEREGVILVNVAPRHGKAKKWPNGTPFGHFSVGNTLVVTSIDGLTLSLIKKLQITESLQLFDIPTVVTAVIEQNLLSKETGGHIIHTQFRSYDFTPRAAAWLKSGIHLPSDRYALSEVNEAPNAIWFIDNFGNCKTTLFPEEVGFKPGKKIQTTLGEILCFERLKDVPTGEPGIIIGSSGFEDKRFIELVIQGESAANRFQLEVGREIL